MQKTISISLGQINFYAEEDAYERLSAYLSAVKRKFENYPDGAEILSDIENRMAEHFLKDRGADRERVIRLSEVTDLVASMGEPEEIGEEAGTPAPVSAPDSGRRLYRNPDDAIIAGVASGIAGYFGAEPVIVRLLFILFTLLNGFGIILYFILWVVVPEAKTATEKLEMKGKAVTLESVDRLMKQAAENVKNPANRERLSGVTRAISRVFETIFRRLVPVIGKILGVVLGIVSGVALFALTFSFALAVANVRSPYVDFPLTEAIHGPLLYAVLFSGFIIILIPLLFILGFASVLTKGWDARKTRWGFGLLGAWFITLIIFGVSVSRAVPTYEEYMRTNPAYRVEVRTYDLKDFSAITARNGFTLELRQGSEFRVEAEARVKDLDALSFAVAEETLSVARGRITDPRICVLCDRYGRITVRITAPLIRSIEGENAVHLNGEDLGGETLNIRLTNASNADITVGTTTRSLALVLENAAGARVEGRVGTAVFSLKNGANLEANDLQADRIEISAVNATHARVNAREEVSGEIRNGSILYYIGTPRLNVDARSGSRVEAQFGESGSD